MSDVQKLILFGKDQRTITITADKEAFVFSLETPTAENLLSPLNDADSIGIVTAYVSSINEQEFKTPTAKADLRKMLSQFQNGVIKMLVGICSEMAIKQNDLTENFTKK